jgi:GDP-L-fucose synthase
MYSLNGKRIFVAGHRGLVGRSLVARLECEGCEVLTAERKTLDLSRQQQVEDWLYEARPDAIFVAAAKVGGIQANNTRPAEFIYENLAIETNLIHAAYEVGVEKLVFLGSSCIYPRLAPQPMPEEALLTGPLEPTNEWYALAKIAGIKMCDAYRRQYGVDFVSIMPTNLYGPGDNFSLEGGHVLPALLRRFHEAKESGTVEVTVWGSGAPLREFLHVEDLADGVVFLTKHYSAEGHMNIGAGEEISIRDLAELIKHVVGFEGAIVFDDSKPDGTPRKLVDASKLRAMGWNPSITLEEGVRCTYDWLLARLNANEAINGWPQADRPIDF